MNVPTKIIAEGRELGLMVESARINYVKPVLAEEEGAEETNGKWVADVWRLGEENLNGRIYTEELARRLIAENPVTMAYDGHWCDYTNGNEYKNAVATCSNLRIEGGLLKCDISFLKSEEKYEAKLKELAERGVQIGVSSVGYGEYEEDGKTIKPESYQLIRVLDFVTQPAGDVYATLTSEEVEEKMEPVVMTTEAMAERDGIIRDFIRNLF